MNTTLTLVANSVYILSLSIGFYSLYKNKKDYLNWTFFILTLSFSFWSFSFSNLNVIQSYESSLIWIKLGISGLFLLSASFLNFSVALSGFHKKINKILLNLFIYIPAAVYSVYVLFFQTEISLFSRKHPEIFNNVKYTQSFTNFIFSIEIFYFGLGILFIIYWRFKSKKENEKRQAEVILFSITIPIIINNLFFMLNNNYWNNIILESAVIAVLFTVLGFWYAINKYKFMTLTPEFALDKILYNMYDFIIITDPEGCLAYANEKIKKILGYKESEIVNKPINLLINSPADLFNNNKGKKNLIIEKTELIKKNGQIIPIQLYCIPEYAKNKKILGYILICHDISEKLRLENQIEECKIMANSIFAKDIEYKRTLEIISDGIFVIDKNFKIILFNRQFFNYLYKLPDDNILDKKLTDIFTEERDLDFINDYIDIFKTGEIKISEESKFIENRERFFEIRKIPTIINNKVEKIATIINDVTDKKQKEKINIRTEKIESLGVLAAGIAHDFNNILTGIIGNISLAELMLTKENTVKLDEVRELLALSEKATNHARTLTSQLLTFSKGGSPLLNHGSIIDLVKDTATFCLSGSNIEFSINAKPDLWEIKFDENQLANVLNNIFINSKQAIKENGKIEVSIENIDLTNKKNIENLKTDRYLLIKIKDNGTGIKQKILDKIFDPYFTTKTNGSGLGLATAYSIIQKHNGFIDIKSKENEFAIVNIYLPVIKDAEKKIKSENIDAVVQKNDKQNPLRILFMDDDNYILLTISKIFKHLGHILTLTNNVADAVNIYKSAYKTENQYDIVILDLTIKGGQGGKEAIKEILKINPDVTAVVCSGYSNDELLSNFVKYGFKAKINKPFSIEDITKTLNELSTSI